MCGAGTGRSCRQLFKHCKILTVTSLCVFKALCCLKKYKSSVQKNKQVCDHNTRTNMDLHIKTCNINLYKKCIINMGIRLYNKVPIHIQKLEEYIP